MAAILKCLIVPTTYFTINSALELTKNKLLTINMSTKQMIGIKYSNLEKKKKKLGLIDSPSMNRGKPENLEHKKTREKSTTT